MFKICHILPHTGGGVGSVLLNLISNLEAVHEVCCLDTNLTFIGDYINNISELFEKIKESDVVIIHMWNHPLLYKFLLENKLPECRLIMWYHNSGIYAPYIINKNLIDMSDFFIVTSPVCYNSEAIKTLPLDTFNKKIKCIWSTRGVEKFLTLQPKPHFGFNVGYIGTLDYSKLHKNFTNMCYVEKFNIQFILCGEISNKVKNDVTACPSSTKFSIRGNVKNIEEHLQSFDVFGYPLSPYHFGTCEQVLGEAMAAGVVPLVLNNSAESYIITHGINGFIVDESDYSRALLELRDNVELRNKLSINARKSAKILYSTDTMISNWKNVIEQCMLSEKTEKQFSDNISKKTGFEIFKISINNPNFSIEDINKSIVNIDHWFSETKASPKHYLKFFQDDKDLKSIVDKVDVLKTEMRNVY